MYYVLPNWRNRYSKCAKRGCTGVDLSIVKYGGRGQSGQAIKLFQITSYVSDFQTLNNLGSSQPVGASKY